MPSADQVIAQIHAAFDANEYPGDRWLQGSSEGYEPSEEVGPFVGRSRWQDIEPAMLDAHQAALSFFSEAGFRFFLPAFLVADLRGQLQAADPLGHLTGGFHTGEVELPAGGRTFVQRYGGMTLVNPLRYGALTMEDYGRFRLSIFTREESAAIVSYLEYRADAEEIARLREPIVSALDAFWRARAVDAPVAADLQRHVAERQAYVDALHLQQEESKRRTRGERGLTREADR